MRGFGASRVSRTPTPPHPGPLPEGEGVRKGTDAAMGRIGHFRWLAAIVVFFALSCSQQSERTKGPPPTQGPIVRVKLLPDQKQVTLTAQQPPQVRLGADGAGRRLDVAPGAPVPITLTASGWTLGQA